MAGQITTPVDLIHLCLKTAGVVGVGQTPDFEDTNDCFSILNSFLGQITRERFLVYHLVDVAFLSNGAISYTIGAGGDFNVPRPDRLEAAYARLLPVSTQPFDYPLTLIDSREDYSAITLKHLTTFPNSVFYDSDWPLGHVFVWPVPQNEQFEVHLVIKETLTQFPTLTTPINLPPEYLDMLIWNLSVRIRPLYQMPPDPTIIALAKNSLAVIRQSNTQIPQLRMPSSVMNASSGHDPTLGNLQGLPWAF